MGGEWRQSTWGAEISLEYGKSLRDYRSQTSGYRVFGSNGPIGWTKEPLVEGPGVILGRKGAYRGVEYWEKPFSVIDTAYYVVPKSPLNMRWLYYAIKFHRLGEIDDGSPIPSTTRSAVYVRPLSVPSELEQDGIAYILGTLDKKIELNRQTNETLEAMAQAMFKSWFVDFDPVIDNALAAGNDIPEPFQARAAARQALGDARKPLPEEIRCEFPNEFVFSDGKGWVPRGWGVGTLESITRIKNGKKPPSRIQGGVLVYGSNGVIGSCADSNCEDAVIIGRVGTYCGSLHFSKKRCWVSDNAMQIEMKEKKQNQFLLRFLERSSLNDMQTGSGQPLLNQSILNSIKICIPKARFVDYFSEIGNSLAAKMDSSNEASQQLMDTRDTLLPKLLSGQLTIPNAEKLVAEAL